jgi:ribonuclease VapC
VIIDSSSALAIYFNEPLGPWALDQFNRADRLLMSTVNLTECLLRIRSLQPGKADQLEAELLGGEIEFIPPDKTQAILAARARLQFPLNLGDCFAYALAKTQGFPLLTLDRDFRSTDLQVILPPEP